MQIPHAIAGSILTAFIGQGVLVLSGVVVARMLEPENRGQLALISFLPLILAQVSNLGLPQAVAYYAAKDGGCVRSVAYSILLPAALQTAAVVSLHMLLLPVFFAGSPRVVWAAAALSIAAGPALLAQQYGLALLQGQRRFRAFNVLRVLPPSMYTAATLMLFVTKNEEFILIALAWAFPLMLTAIATMAFAVFRLSAAGEQNSPTRLEMIRFGLKGFLGYASPVETFRLEHAVIGLFLSPAALGLYVVGLALTSLPRFIAQSIGMVAYPRIAAEPDPVAARHAMWRFFWLTVGVCTLVIGPIWAGAGFLVPFFFGNDFAGAVSVTRILLLGSVFFAARRILADATRGLGMPQMGSIAEIGSWLVLFPTLAIMAPLWGIDGVAAALAISGVAALAVLVVMLIFWAPLRKPFVPRAVGET